MRRPPYPMPCVRDVKKLNYDGSGAARVRASLVGVITRDADVPVEMTNSRRLNSRQKVCKGHGMILESKVVGNATTYSSIVLAPATLFKRPNGIKPKNVQCDVFVSDGRLYKGKLLRCDFHYNLALIRIRTNFHLHPVTLRGINDVASINGYHYEVPLADQDSSLFKVKQGTKIMIVHCSSSPPFSVKNACGVFCASHLFHHDCKELCRVKCPGAYNKQSGAVINLSGEVLGIMLKRSAFLPSNFISRWWNHYKIKRVCRPWVGVEVLNLAEAELSILDQLKYKFSDIGTGVIVTKVEKDTPAYHSGITLKDVIIECDGKPIHSKIQFFESMWENTKNCVELTVLRASNSQPLHLNISIEETTRANYNRWMSFLPPY